LRRAMVRSRRVRAVSAFHSAAAESVVVLGSVVAEEPLAGALAVDVLPSGAGEAESPSAEWRTTCVVAPLRLS